LGHQFGRPLKLVAQAWPYFIIHPHSFKTYQVKEISTCPTVLVDYETIYPYLTWHTDTRL